MTKKDILENDLNDKELKEASAGANSDGTQRCQALLYSYIDEDANNCVNAQYRWIYGIIFFTTEGTGKRVRTVGTANDGAPPVTVRKRERK